ncbi:MAG: hypothetical protein OHK0013_45250 [Sandaracinaceae bacterium]
MATQRRAAAKPRTTETKKGPAPRALAREGAALREALDEALKRVRKLRAEGAKGWDELWETVDAIVSADPPLWRGRYGSEAEFIRKELPGETPRSVKRNVLVARTFTPADEAALGPSLLEELALYLQEREGLSKPPPHVALDRVMVLVPHGKETVRLPARTVDVEQVRAARRALRKQKSKRPEGPMERAIRGALKKQPALRGVSVRVAQDRVSLGNVPASEVQALGKALASVKV